MTEVISLLLGLARNGGYQATRITADAGGLLHHLFTITVPTTSPKSEGFGGGREGAGYLFSVALIRQVTPPRVLPDAAPCRVRTFLDPANGAATVRPAWGNRIIPLKQFQHP